MKQATILLSIICLSFTVKAQNYNFNGSMTRDVLENYLNKSITMQGMSDISQGEAFLSEQERLKNINMIKNIGAKFIGRMIGWWENAWGQDGIDSYISRCSLNIANIKANDPQVICQAGIFEYVSPTLNYINIPSYVFEAFNLPIETRTFNYESTLYPAPASQYTFGWGPMTENDRISVPDIKQIETQLWFYYLATRYISIGCEAIHLGQVEMMNRRDIGNVAYWNLLTKIRAYARTRNRGIVLCDAHTLGLYYEPTLNISLSSWNNYKPKYSANKQLLLDFHAQGIYYTKKAPCTSTMQPVTLETTSTYGPSLLGNSLGGQNPLGWSSLANPSLFEYDHGGVSNVVGCSNNESWNLWGWDDMSWFAQQNEQYRNDILKYTFYQLKQLDNNAHLEMPGMRPVSPGNNIPKWIYRANTGYQNQENTIKEIWNGKYDISTCAPTYYTSDYNYCPTNCWNENQPRFLSDVNGDGKDDIIGFGNTGVYVSFSNGTSFTNAILMINDFGYQNGNGWLINKHPRLIGDINGDGKTDIVGFGNNGVYLSLSTGTGFTSPSLVLQDFNYNNGVGWTENHPRFLADVNGDGKDDIVGFGNAGVYVSYSTGIGFTGASLKINNFGYNYGSGWSITQNPRLIGDINGDGKADIVGFANNGVYLSLSTGNGFSSPSLVLQDFNYNNGIGWTENHPRFLGDINGDGKDDIIGFGNDGVYIAYSSGISFTGATIATKNYGYNYGNGWNTLNHPRIIGHINNDAKADIVGFGDLGTYVSTSIGSENSLYTIMSPPTFYPEYGYNNGNGWLPNKHPRLLGDIDGDGKDEIVGFGYNGVYVMNCGINSNSFKQQNTVQNNNNNNNSENYDILIFPNPTKGIITIQFKDISDEIDYHYTIYNIVGIKVLESDIVGNHTTRVDLSNFPKGLYFVNLYNINKNTSKKSKVILQ